MASMAIGVVLALFLPTLTQAGDFEAEIATRSFSQITSCVHGYVSAADKSTCICNYGWIGPECNIDALPSCTKGDPDLVNGLSCTSSLSHLHRFDQLPCECIAECVDYVRIEIQESFGINESYSSEFIPLPVHPEFLARCKNPSIERLLNLKYIREAKDKERQAFFLLPEYATTSFSDCYGNCSDVAKARCVNHFCECPTDRVGAFCQSPAKGGSPRARVPDQRMLTFQILEVNGFSIADREVEELYRLRQDHWGPFFFVEQLYRDGRNLIVDDMATVVILPHLNNPGAPVHEWLAFRQSHSQFPKTAQPLNESLFLSLSAGFLANDKWIKPKSFEPRNSMYLQNNVAPGEMSKMHISVPIHDFKFMMDIDQYRRKDQTRKNLTGLLEDLNSVRDQRQKYYDSSQKEILLFFVGQTKIWRMNLPAEADCLGPKLVTSNDKECPCLKAYSECMRQFIYHNYRDNPDMFLRDVNYDKEILKREATEKIQSQDPGLLASQMAIGPEMAKSKFCLVAGGAGFDTRIVSSVMSGCIPLWTMTREVPPLNRVLRYERFMVFLGGHERSKLLELPAFLNCYTTEIRAAMVANLELMWPAFMWGTGTAYHHVLLEMAEITNKLVPSAVEAILTVQGPKYMAELLTVDFSPYQGLVSGIDEVIRLREQHLTNDPMVNFFEEAAKCREPL